LKRTESLHDESEFVSLLKSKDKSGIEKLYDNYSDSLFGVIFKIVKEENVAEDLLQETFIKVWKKIDSYDSSKGRLFTWMLNIARNGAIDYTRSKHYNKSLKVQSIDNTVYNQSDARSEIKEESIGIKELVNQLEPKFKTLIDKFYFEGYTQQEVSDELEIPLGTVKTRIRQAIIELRKVFE
jgi:RNA polymerase sigma-70 factor (ECF subfamily)